MNIPIELIGVVFLFLIFIFWLIYKKISNWILYKRYKPEYDKSRKGKEQGRTTTRSYISTPERIEFEGESVEDVPKPSGLGERSNIQVDKTESVGKTDSSNGKVSRKFLNPFTRRRK